MILTETAFQKFCKMSINLLDDLYDRSNLYFPQHKTSKQTKLENKKFYKLDVFLFVKMCQDAG